MGLAEQMLASMSVDDVTEKHSQKEEEHVVVNESRQIVVPNSLKTIAVTKDEDVQTITFDCVRFWDGNDLSTFAIYLNYVLPDGTPATYIPESVVTSDGDAFYHFEWKIKNNITQKSGKISIGITAIKTKVDEGGETVVDKRWSSLPNTDCSIALGIDVSDVPTEEESAGVVAQLTAILEKIQGDLDEWLTDNVVQTTGTSKSKVMSQEAVTIELEKEKNRSNSYVDKKYMELDNLIVRTSKRVENIETGLQEGSFVTDDSVEYQKNVPQNALRYAELKSVGGMTYRDEATNTLKDSPVTAVKSVGENLITNNTAYGYIDSAGGFQSSLTTTNQSCLDYIAVNGTVTVHTNVVIHTIGVAWYDGNKNFLSREQIRSTKSATRTVPDGAKFVRVFASYDQTPETVWSFASIELMLNRGSTALPYSPYTESPLPNPAAVQSVDGWGQGIDATYNNHIAWSEDGTEKTYNKMVYEFVLDGSTDEVYSINSAYSGTLYNCFTINLGAGKWLKAASVGVCNQCEITTSATILEEDAPYAYFGNVSIGQFFFKLPKATAPDVATLRTYLVSNPVIVLYVATPEVTDISSLITSDNFIGVEGGGTLTFENEYGYDVPSEVEYQVEV